MSCPYLLDLSLGVKSCAIQTVLDCQHISLDYLKCIDINI